MKKFVITVSLGIIIISAGLVILLGLRSLDGNGTMPSYHFLGGRNPIACEKGETPNEDKRYFYSFEADFNDICSKADAELIGAGFAGKSLIDETHDGNEYMIRSYYLKERFPRGPVWIYIYDNRRYEKLGDSEHYAIEGKDGWIMVEVIYWRGWRWPF